MITGTRREWALWMSVQFASIFCVVTAAVIGICGLTRLNSAYAVHMLLLAILFYGLHWRLQGKANYLDPVRSERIVAAIQHRQSRYESDW